MAKYYLEPTIAPRGPDVVALEGRKRVISAARLDGYRVPRFCEVVLGHRQVMMQPGTRLLGPLSGVQEGLNDLVAGVEGGTNGNNRA